jgi:hypothetical protein
VCSTDASCDLLEQINSLDKKLRKLDVAMHAKDDGYTMPHAMNSYASNGFTNLGEESDHINWSCLESSAVCSTDVSNAVTPCILASPSGSGARTPSDAPFPSARRPQAAPTKSSHSATSALVNVLPHEHAHSHSSPVEFDQMIDNASSQVDVWYDASSSKVDATAPRGEESACLLRIEVEDGNNTLPLAPSSNSLEGGMSDEDLIAMLAGCAAKRPHSPHNNFAQLLNECINSVAQEAKYSSGSETLPEADAASEVRLEAGDEELMAALANCCGGQSPFQVLNLLALLVQKYKY